MAKTEKGHGNGVNNIQTYTRPESVTKGEPGAILYALNFLLPPLPNIFPKYSLLYVLHNGCYICKIT